MSKKLYINGIDAFAEWGVSLAKGSVNLLKTPPPLKERVKNSSRVLCGVQYVSGAVVDERTVSLVFNLRAKDGDDFDFKLDAFTQYIMWGEIIELTTDEIPGIIYRLMYQSTPSLNAIRRLGVFTMKFIEPDPTNRY